MILSRARGANNTQSKQFARKRHEAERAFALELLVLAGVVEFTSLRKAMRIARRVKRQEAEEGEA